MSGRRSGPKKKYSVSQSHRTVSLRLSTHLYDRWCALKCRMKLKTNDITGEYLLNLADTVDMQESPRYIRAFVVHTFISTIIYRETPHHSMPTYQRTAGRLHERDGPIQDLSSIFAEQ